MVVKELFARLGLDVDQAGFQKADSLLGGLGKTMLGLGAAVGAGLAGLAVFAKQTASAGDAAAKASQKYGVSIEAIQAIGYAAEFAGSSMEEVGLAMQFLAKKGSKDVEGDFRRLADTLQTMPDGGAKTALVIDRMGRSAANLIPLLNGGSAGLDAMRAEALSLGAILSEDVAKAGERFNDTLDRIGKRATGLRNRLLGPWLDRLEKMLVSIELVIAGVSNAIVVLSEHVRLIALVIGSVLFAALVTSAGGFAALTAASAVSAAAMIASALASAAAWAVALAPVTALAAAFIAIGLILEDLYVGATGGESVLFEGIPALADALKRAVTVAVDFWRSAFTELFDWMAGRIADLVSTMTLDLAPKGVVLGGLLGAARGALASGAGGAILGGAAGAILGGGASSPSASAGASSTRNVVAPTFNAVVNITGSGVLDPQAAADATISKFEAWNNARLSDAYAAVGGS